jgi:hypothetical protein
MNELATCPSCAGALDPGAQFCGACGHALATPPPQPEQWPQAPPPPQAPPGQGGQPPVQPGQWPQPPTPPGQWPHPSTPPSYGAPGGPPAGNRNQTVLFSVLAGVLVLLLVGVGAFVVLRDDAAVSMAAGEVLLEPADTPGPDAFTATVAAGRTPPVPVRLASARPADAPAARIRSVQGSSPGLYGGTRNESACDPEQLISFLQANPDKAAAFAQVEGIVPSAIPQFVRGLTPLILRADTRVTNHGFRAGRATPRHAVLQAGTAVLVDNLGIPRVKCGCGNPLAPAAPIATSVTYRGRQWPGFYPHTIINVVNTTQITVTEFVVVDLARPGFFVRPVGASTPMSPPADADVVTDTFCDLFPEACAAASDVPERPDEPVLGTGDVQVTLRWFSTADLDLAVTDPTGERVSFDNPVVSSGGQLDVDSNAACDNATSSPVENVFWPSGRSPDGTYTIEVTYYDACGAGSGPQAFELTFLVNGRAVEVATGTVHGQPVTLTLAREVAQAKSGTVQAPGDTVTYTGQKDPIPPANQQPPPAPSAPGPPAPSDADASLPTGPTEPPPEEPETLEQYCDRLYGPPPEYAYENVMYTLCMHDPTSDDAVDPSSLPLPAPAPEGQPDA